MSHQCFPPFFSISLKWSYTDHPFAPSHSGLVAYREFTQAGFDVFLFERDTVPGGAWHYTKDGYTNKPISNADVSIGNFVPSLPPEGVTLPYEEHYEGGI